MLKNSQNFDQVLLILYNPKYTFMFQCLFIFVLWNASRNLDFTKYSSSELVHEMNTDKFFLNFFLFHLGMTELVLHEAAANGEWQTLESMLMIQRIDVDHKDEDFGDRTALHWAASKGNGTICLFTINFCGYQFFFVADD